jgi:hypothetical protein
MPDVGALSASLFLRKKGHRLQQKAQLSGLELERLNGRDMASSWLIEC